MILSPCSVALPEQVHALPVIGFGAVGVGGNALFECGDGLVDLASVGEHRADIEVGLRGRGRVGLRGQFVGLDRVIDLVSLGVGVRQVVVVSGQVLGVRWDPCR